MKLIAVGILSFLSMSCSMVLAQKVEEKLCFDRNSPRPDLRPITSAVTRNGHTVLYSDCCPMVLKPLSAPLPKYPSAARAVGAKGNVSVKVFINRKGRVFWAEVEDGHPLLHAEALKAACRTVFEPYICNCGKKRKEEFQTVLNFNFVFS